MSTKFQSNLGKYNQINFLDNPLQKREDFAISLRKKKKAEILVEKRKKLA